MSATSLVTPAGPTPSLSEALSLRGEGQLLPIYRECLADTETPVAAYVKLRQGAPSLLLESVEGGERQGRYSIVAPFASEAVRFLPGIAEHETEAGVERSPCSDPLAFLDGILRQRRAVPRPGLPPFHGGAIGFLGWDIVRFYEDIGPAKLDPYGLPLGHLAFCDTLLVFDHVRHTLKVVSHVRLDGDVGAEYRSAELRIDALLTRLRAAAPLGGGDALLGDVPIASTRVAVGASNVTRERYEEMVRQAKEYIAAGDAFQVVPSQRFSVPTEAPALAIYRALRVVNPSPYMFLLDFGPYQLVGSSPEILVAVEDGSVATRPLAGSRPRGVTPEEDQNLARELLASEKERAEHIMLVDLGRNDLGRVCTPGTVHVDDLMFVERYSHIMHIASHVSGQIRAELSPLDALRACFPAGTVSGAPKIRAMQIISELEPEGRGPYAGAIGYFGYNGNLVSAITLRTLVVKDGVAHVQAGCGVVADSDPAAEYEESVTKAQALLSSVRLAEQLLASAEARVARPETAPAPHLSGGGQAPGGGIRHPGAAGSSVRSE